MRQYGDSTTAGLTFANGAYVTAKPTAAERLYADLQTQFGGAAKVDDQGVSATCAVNLLNGDGVHAPFAQEIQTTSAQIVTFNFGINDSYHCGETTDSFADHLAQLVQLAQATGKTVVLEEPNPVTAPTIPNVAAYSAVVDQVARSRGIPLVQQYAPIQAIAGWQQMLPDGIHPNEALYAMKGDREAQTIAPIVKQLLQ
ncbi:hypothetical protein WJ85_17125 [Burkholderia ubonensis]|nr:hypothetical protein WJ85_17125 [Burkholderia ubonensis]